MLHDASQSDRDDRVHVTPPNYFFASFIIIIGINSPYLHKIQRKRTMDFYRRKEENVPLSEDKPI